MIGSITATAGDTDLSSTVRRERLQREATIRREWLEQEVDAALERAPVVVLIGPPGTGKTVFAQQLAAAWRCGSYFVRFGSANTVLSTDPKTMFVSLGLQLREKYGSSIFGDPLLAVNADVSVKTAGASANVEAASIGTVSVSPFRRIVINARADIGQLDGRAAGVTIRDVRDLVAEMSVGELAVEALLNPLRVLEKQRPEEKIHLIIDAVDDTEIARCVPLPSELSPNARLLITTRDDQVVNRLEADGASSVECLRLAEGDLVRKSTEDIARYLEAQLSEPKTIAALQASAAGLRTLDEVALDLANASEGNFLFAHHLAATISTNAAKGDFSFVLSPQGVPRGLDGIYRYFVTEKLRAGISLDEWAETRAPILGVLAVARDALTSRQIALFSGVSRMKIDAVCEAIESLLVPVEVEQDLAVQFYHRSFADFLLEQNRARNPLPLESAATYHALIASRYENIPEASWDESNDLYALLHLPAHLEEAGLFNDAASLLGGSFGRRQGILLGPSKSHADCLSVARAAALARNHKAFLLLSYRASRIAQDIEEEWRDGRFVLSLCSTEGSRIAEQAQWASGHIAPWSAFLVAERLLDIGDVDSAREVLRDAEAKLWANYAPPRHGFNLLEGSGWDYVMDDSVIGFLARLALLDPDLTLRLVERLFEDGPVLPNVRTVWRDVVFTVISTNEAKGIPSNEARALAETTLGFVRRGGYLLGMVGVSRALFRLLRYCADEALAEPLWLANAILTASHARAEASKTVIGAEHNAALWGTLADTLAGALDIWLAVSSIAPGKEISDAFEGTWKVGVDVVPDHPNLEEHVGECSRVEWLGQLAFVLHRAGSSKAAPYAAAALECARHDARWKRWSDSIAAGLSWICRIPETTIQTASRDLLAALGLPEQPAAKLDRPKFQEPHAYVDDKLTDALDALTKEHDPYARGRITLELWKRHGNQHREQLASALAEARRGETRQRKKREFSVPDVIAESLASVVAASSAAFAPAALHDLISCRTEEGQSASEVDPEAVRAVRWHALRVSGRLDVLAAEATEAYDHARNTGDPEVMLDCCLAILPSDPNVASAWFNEIREVLTDPMDRGAATSLLVTALHAHHPELMASLGITWANQLPEPEGSAIAGYELSVCKQWSPIAELRKHVLACFEHVATTIPEEVKRLREREASQARRSPEDSVVWQRLGRILECCSHVDTDSPEAAQAANALQRAVLAEVDRAGEGQTAWRVRNAAREVLKAMDEAAGGEQLTEGPIVSAVQELFARAVTWPATETGPSGESGWRRAGVGDVDAIGSALPAVALLKTAAVNFSLEQFRSARSLLDALIVGRVIEDDPMNGMFSAMSEAMIAGLGGGFLSNRRDRASFGLMSGLVRWCTTVPTSKPELVDLQVNTSALRDRDLRFSLMAPLARGWLDVQDFERATQAARVAPIEGLSRVGFVDRLLTLSNDSSLPGEKHRPFELLLLDLIPRAMGRAGDDLKDLLTAWFATSIPSAKEQSHDELDALVTWVVSAQRNGFEKLN